ncbi:MAG TPA: class II aldolase/adducin family protein [Stellaceae bacterium]|nr:class II aldolase/adducin family protein [Stellaceae bacterium]
MRQLLGPFAAALLLLTVPACAQSPAQSPDAALIEDVVVANHILYDQGVVDGFGHVSVRSKKDPNHFLMARSMAPGLVTAADILEFDLDGNAVDNPQGRAVYLERFIHSEVYKAHPEVKSVVHSHSPSVIPFGATGVPLRPIYHMSSFLGTGVPIFEIRQAGGDATDMLVRNPALGAALARTLGNASVLLMRGHGDVVVGDSVRLAVFRAIYTEVNAKLELEALRLGQVTFLNDQEAAASMATNAALIDRAWDLWKMKATGGRN